MNSKVLQLMKLLFVLATLFSNDFAQQKGNIFTIHHDVGETIDKDEKERFCLFENVEYFHQAKVFQISEDEFEIHFKLLSTSKIKVVEYSLKSIIEIHKKINDVSSNILEEESPLYPGINVILNEKDGNTTEGKLVEVLDSLMIIRSLKDENLLENNKESTLVFSLSEIESVTIVKESKVLSGMAAGFLGGAGMGAFIGLISGDDSEGMLAFSAGAKALIAGATLGIIGGLVGAVIGAGQSENEELVFETQENLNYLNKLSPKPKTADKAQKSENSLKSIEKKLEVVKPEIKFNKRFGISFFLTSTSSGPAEQIEDQMNKISFDHSTSGFFSSGKIYYPKSNTGFGTLGTPWLVSLKYYCHKSIIFGATYSENPIGWTSGYNDQAGFLRIQYSVNTLAAMAWYKYDVLSVGAGPALHFTKAWEDNVFSKNDKFSKTKLGLVVECGFAYPAYTTFFISVVAQYRLVGNIDIGPFEVDDYQVSKVFQSTNVNYNHFSMCWGIGIRL